MTGDAGSSSTWTGSASSSTWPATTNGCNGGNYREDPYPVWHELREQAPVHAGTVHELSGVEEDFVFHGLP